MALYFSKRIRVFPFVLVNISRGKNGFKASVTLGVRGCSVNYGAQGLWFNSGLDHGVSYRKKLRAARKLSHCKSAE